MHDLLIRNGTVIDGTGRPCFVSDVAIDGDRIVEVGNLGAGHSAWRTIDADGRIVALSEMAPATEEQRAFTSSREATSMTRPVVLPCALLALLLASDLTALEDLTALRAQIQHMQDENVQLRARIDQQDALIRELLAKVDALVGDAEADETHATNGESFSAESASGSQEPVTFAEDPSAPPNLVIRGFADVNYVAFSDRGELAGRENSFALNELDLLLTSQLSNELSVLSEVVFHFGVTDDLSFFEIERFYLKYSPSDLFNIKFGRIHTPIGYWNQAFHHGAWFQTTVTRPEIFKFEDDRGILPVHSVGVELLGVQRAGPLLLCA